MKFITRISIFIVMLLTICLPDAFCASGTVILATTTSTQDSGLLDEIVPAFEKWSGVKVKTISVGSGQALKMGEKGEVDILLVHSPEAEKKFMFDGFGINRRLVMHNDFVIAGPSSDPAGIKGKSSVEALKMVAEKRVLFISRGDNSGTHAKEKGLWKAVGINPEKEKWYQQTGSGMGQSLSIAAEKKGYILTDRATYLSLSKVLGLTVLSEGDPKLLNIYHLIELPQHKHHRLNSEGGKKFADFMLSKKGQEIIGSFGVKKYGAPLFVPDAGKKGSELGL